MKKNRREYLLHQLVEPIVTGLGFSLWGIHAPLAGKKSVVSIFVDGENGINLDECAKISRDVGLAIEVEDLMPGAYTLEVSSPGLERRFFELDQLAGYEGRTLKAELAEAQDGRRKFAGVLTGVDESSFTLRDEEDVEHRIEWDLLKKVRLVHEF